MMEKRYNNGWLYLPSVINNSAVFRNISTTKNILFDPGISLLPNDTSFYSDMIFEDVDGDSKKDIIVPSDSSISGVSSLVFRNTSSIGGISFDIGFQLIGAGSTNGPDPLFEDVDDGK